MPKILFKHMQNDFWESARRDFWFLYTPKIISISEKQKNFIPKKTFKAQKQKNHATVKIYYER